MPSPFSPIPIQGIPQSGGLLGRPVANAGLLGMPINDEFLRQLTATWQQPKQGIGGYGQPGPGTQGTQGLSANGMGNAMSPGGIAGTIGQDANNISVPATMSNVMDAIGNVASLAGGPMGFLGRQAMTVARNPNMNFNPLSVQQAMQQQTMSISQALEMGVLSPEMAMSIATGLGLGVDSSGSGGLSAADQGASDASGVGIGTW